MSYLTMWIKNKMKDKFFIFISENDLFLFNLFLKIFILWLIYFIIFNIFTEIILHFNISKMRLYYQKFLRGNFTTIKFTIIYVNMSGKIKTSFESTKILACLKTMFVFESSRKRRTYSSSYNSWSLFWSLVASRYFLSSWKGVRVYGQSLLRLAGLPLTSITLITAAGMAIIKLFYANASRFRVANEFFFFSFSSQMLITRSPLSIVENFRKWPKYNRL